MSHVPANTPPWPYTNQGFAGLTPSSNAKNYVLEFIFIKAVVYYLYNWTSIYYLFGTTRHFYYPQRSEGDNVLDSVCPSVPPLVAESLPV